jgi:lipoprotein-releasing system permease protein
MRLAVTIAAKHLVSRKRQTLVSVGGVAMGVGFAVAMAGMMQGFQEDFVRRVVDNSPHITISDEFRTQPRQPVRLAYPGALVRLRSVKPRDEVRGIKRAGRIVNLLSREPGQWVAPTLQGSAFVRYGSKEVGATVIGVVPEQERRVTKIEEDMIEGTLDDLKTASNGLILGNGLAKKLDVKVNDLVTVVSAKGVILKMKVVGLFRTGIVQIDDAQAYALLKKVQILEKRINVINQIRIRLAEVNRAREIAARIEARFGYKAVSWQEANEAIFGVFVVQNAIMYTTTGAILLVACFGIFNVISTVIYEKYRDIAILKSIGFTRADVQRIFLLEGLVVGAAGSVVGWALGAFLLFLLDRWEFEAAGAIEVTGFPLKHSVWHYALSSALAMMAAVLASYLPARRAAQVKPVDIIRGAA